MKERFIVAPGCNGTELMRTLAKNSVDTMGLRVMSAAELAKTALIRSGLTMPGTYISQAEAVSLLDPIIREVPYFSSASYSDAENMAAALRSLRSLIVGDEDLGLEKLSMGEFPEKNRAILDVYKEYSRQRKTEKLYDEIDLIREAVVKAGTVDAEILTLEEYPFTPLERALAEKISGGAVSGSSLPVLFGKEKKEETSAAFFTRAYGASNEVADVLSYIYRNDIPLDQCVVAVADGSYSQLFYEASLQRGIPMTFGNGVPIGNSNPARLLKAYIHWDTDGYHSAASLRAMVLGEAFDRKRLPESLAGLTKGELEDVLTLAGNLRISGEPRADEEKIGRLEAVLNRKLAGPRLSAKDKRELEEKVRLLPLCRELAGCFACQADAGFLKTYSVIRSGHAGRIDTSSLEVIIRDLDAFFRFNEGGKISEIAERILAKTVCSENSREGCLYVTGIRGAMASMRKHVFIAGLSADVFPGSPSENYLLLDNDYLLFAEEGAAPTSAERIRKKRKDYYDLRRLAAALGAEVRLSYSCYDSAELKEKNPSSVITEEAQREVGFFESDVSGEEALGRAFLAGKEVLCERTEPEDREVCEIREKAYSPSAIEAYFACPRKYMLTRILGLEEPEEEKPLEVIDAMQLGTLIHSCMEAKANRTIPRPEFLKEADGMFEDFLCEHVPVNRELAEKDRKTFLKIIGYAYDDDPKNTVEAAEERIEVLHECGLKLSGYPDRVEVTGDGRHIIPDFKTGNRVRHVADDIDTCIQVAIYAYIMEKNGTPISYGEYRYLRKREVVPFTFNDLAKEQLGEKLSLFKKALETGDFPCTEDEENCRYCTLSGLCRNADRKGDVPEGEADEE